MPAWSSFGIGGTNAHVVVEEAPPLNESSSSRSWQQLVLSAKTRSALDTATTQLAAYLKQHPNTSIADVAYTLQVGRQVFNHKRLVLCQTVEDAVLALEQSLTSGKEGGLRAIMNQEPSNCIYVFRARNTICQYGFGTLSNRADFSETD